MSYFIDAAAKIIEEEGIQSITIRKVADIAGYNSATLYNYFKNLDHLIFFAAMRYVKEYSLNLHRFIENSENALERHLATWNCFCHYSFNKPEIYYAIFFAKLDNPLENYVEEYYKLFPEDLGKQPKDISTMLLKHDIYDRSTTLLEGCVDEGFIKEDDKDDINEMILLVYQGILQKIINKKINYSDAIDKTMKYITQIIKSYTIKK